MSEPSKASLCRHGRPNAKRSFSPASMPTSEWRAGRPRRPETGGVQPATVDANSVASGGYVKD